MKTEPELIDVFALFAMVAVILRNREGEDVAMASYDIAEAMMDERNKYHGDV
jgi:hypothetical protein